jgi:hypothetical protein
LPKRKTPPPAQPVELPPVLATREALDGLGHVASLREIRLSDLDDVGVAMFVVMCETARADVSDGFKQLEAAAKAELLVRIERNGGKAIAHPAFEKIEAVDEWSAWTYNIDALREAAKLLPPAEAVKVVKHYPAWTETIEHPERWEPGSPQSITAIIKRYGEHSEVGRRLEAARSRSPLGKRVNIKAYRALRAGRGHHQ